MKKQIFVLLMILFVICNIFPKGDGNGDGSVNPNSDGKTSDINTDFFQKLKPDDTIKSINDDRNRNTQQNKNRFQLRYNNDFSKDNINTGKEITAELQKLCNNSIKKIRKNIATSKDNKDELNKIKTKFSTLTENSKSFQNILSEEDKKTLKNQLSVINQTENKIIINLRNLEIEYDKDKPSKDKILNLNKNIYKDINKIERQYRAIEWILFEE